MNVVVALPDTLVAPTVRVQIHMPDGPEFEAVVRGHEIRQFDTFRAADLTLPSGQEATVFGTAAVSSPIVIAVAAGVGG